MKLDQLVETGSLTDRLNKAKSDEKELISLIDDDYIEEVLQHIRPLSERILVYMIESNCSAIYFMDEYSIDTDALWLVSIQQCGIPILFYDKTVPVSLVQQVFSDSMLQSQLFDFVFNEPENAVEMFFERQGPQATEVAINAFPPAIAFLEFPPQHLVDFALTNEMFIKFKQWGGYVYDEWIATIFKNNQLLHKKFKRYADKIRQEI